MSDKRQKNRREPACGGARRGEAPKAVQRVESLAAKHPTERQASKEGNIEEVVERENLQRALKRVRANKGGPGVDGMTVDELGPYLKEHWPVIRAQLLAGTYRSQPVRRVEIPKSGGGRRKLGIPTVLDRFIQQAVLQVLGPRWDRTFSEASYGFRPGRSAHQAVAKAQGFIAEGFRHVVDIDLERFFDRVNHDKLMGLVARRVADARLLRLIRAFLNAGVMADGLVGPTDEGTPQGGPLSPLLSNVMLDELDRELERRGHRFVRYADDCNVYVRTHRAGERVMEGVTSFIERKLKLKVNAQKSAVARPWERKFLGFSFTRDPTPKRRIAPQAIERFKKRVREETRRTRRKALPAVISDLGRFLTGWRGYFAFCETPSVLQALDAWTSRRIRCFIWSQWKTQGTRYQSLRRQGVSKSTAARTVASARYNGPWRLSRSIAMSQAYGSAKLAALGLPRLAPPSGAQPTQPPCTRPVRTVV